MTKHNFTEAEKRIIDFWEQNKIFNKSVEKESPNGDYVFYDGPPFATGTPHYGHIVASCLKDVVPRYWTMKGYRVDRVWGWDCHGLPIENIVEKELELESKKEIEDLGIEKFNRTCRTKVLLYADEWKKVIKRLGRFVDMENAYKTMDKDYMESIWWVFKQLWDKDYIYEGYKSMHICPRCETTLSQSEVAQGYEDVKDLSATAMFELQDEPNTFLLAWTTTPWTLPGNLALAIGPDIQYVKVLHEDNKYILAKELVEKIFTEKEYSIENDVDVKDLVGKKYKPLFPYFENAFSYEAEPQARREDSFVIVEGTDKDGESFVNTEEGTGIVHIAPGFGEDDRMVGEKYNLPFIQHVGLDGRFTDAVTDWPGREVKPKEDTQSTDVEIIKYLAKKGVLFAKEKYEHSYPHCWRCDSPLLNYTTSSWFVAVTKFKDRMLELAKEINWVPAHLKEGRFGQWLDGVRDWSISRQRFWGSVMPLWTCECGEQKVFGSIQELEKASGQKIEDLHKDIVDKITIPCGKCDQHMHRIPDVLDCWFESGSMPYAQMHYPFENKEKFEKNFPAEYIAEGVDQTRCWFYYLHVLSTAIKDTTAYKNVVVNGIVLAEDGKKMSKRLQNYPDPMEMMDKYGADAMRLYLMSSPVVHADDFRFSEKGVDEVFKKVMMIWNNVYSFYEMYLDKDLFELDIEVTNILDQWVLARLNQFIDETTKFMDNYDLMKASRLFIDFINDVSTWYVRRSRDRFKIGDERERACALQVLSKVLLKANKVMAPFIPFITEDLYQKLKQENDPESIHLCKFPKAKVSKQDQELLDKMDQLRNIVELVLSIRQTKGIKIRQALSTLEIKDLELSEDLQELLKDELNVKELSCVKELSQGDNWILNNGFNLDIALNIEITHDLKLEGLSRELIRNINLLRKEKGFTVSDKANITISTQDKEILESLEKFKNVIMQNTQSQDINVKDEITEKKEFEIDVEKV